MAHLSVARSVPPQLLLSLREGVKLSEEGHAESPNPPDTQLVRNPSQGMLRTLLALLSESNCSEDDLVNRCAQLTSTDPEKIFYYVNQLKRKGLLQYQLIDEHGPLATLISTGAEPTSNAIETAHLDTSYQLSSFCYIRADKGDLLLQSPLAHAKLVLHSERVVTLLHRLTTPNTLRKAVATNALDFQTAQILCLQAVQMLGTLLIQCKALQPAAGTERGAANQPVEPSQWAFHDLLFHAHSRPGRHDTAVGKTYPFMGQCEPLPAVKSPMSSSYIQLQEVDLDAIETTDPAFTTVLERRRSLSGPSSAAISVEQIGELLFRTARVRAHHPRSTPSSAGYDRTSRPYPSGGAVYELEIYLIANECEGLDHGLYHYQPDTHRLYPISGRTPELNKIVQDAHDAIAQLATPQALFVITARHQRLSWAYESVSYALTLKNVGALYQTLYLVATAMNLSARAIGTGNTDLFAKASGLDYYLESSVGEFVVNNGAAT